MLSPAPSHPIQVVLLEEGGSGLLVGSVAHN
jgi:hypothetical protein